MVSSVVALPKRLSAPRQQIETTLLSLILTVAEVTDDEAEIVATVLHLISSGKVRLSGNFRNQRLSA